MGNKLVKRGNGTRQRVYDFIVEYIKKNGYAPTIREIGEAVSIKSTSNVVHHLIKLEYEGKIVMKDKAPRAIKLVGYEFVKVGGCEMATDRQTPCLYYSNFAHRF